MLLQQQSLHRQRQLLHRQLLVLLQHVSLIEDILLNTNFNEYL
jgi:hypothetical protein